MDLTHKLNRLVIVASIKDLAGINVANYLIENHGFLKADECFEGQSVYIKDDVKLIFTQKDLLKAEHLDAYFDPICFIFISRHKSESKVPCLTAHFPGNFADDTSFGGRGKELAFTYPSLMMNYMKALTSLADEAEGYDIVVETTHHGPTSLKKPVLFVEIGSSEEQWNDHRAIKTVSKALADTIKMKSSAQKVGIGFGGPHYSQKFTKALVKEDFGLGAIAPKHMLSYVDEEIIDQMIIKSIEPVHYAVLDWKGLGQEKIRLLKLLEDKGLEVVRL